MLTKLKSWFSREPNTSDINSLLRSMSSSGEVISPQRILSHPACFRAVNLISDTVAKIPFNVYRKNTEGREIASNHPAQYLLKHKPNNLYNKNQLMKCFVVNALVHGNGYIYIERDEFGLPVQLFLLDPASVSVILESNELYYTFWYDGRLNKIESNQMLHLRGLGTDALCGLPVYSLLAETFGTGLTLQRYQNLYFKNSAKPNILIHLPPEYSKPEKIEEFREAFGSVHAGIENSFKPALLMPNTSITTLQNDKAIESLSTLRESDIIAIANVFGLPAHKLGGKLVSVAYGSVAEEQRSFMNDIDSWICQIEVEFSKLLRSREINSHYVEANRDAVIQIDPKQKAELFAIYRNNGLMSDQEIRQKMNLPIDMVGDFWSSVSLNPREIALNPPEPQQQQIEEEPIEEEEVEETEENETAKKLSLKSVERMIRRIEKSGKIDWSIIENELGDLPNLQAFSDSLPDEEEIASVLPEQRIELLKELDLNKINEELWKI